MENTYLSILPNGYGHVTIESEFRSKNFKVKCAHFEDIDTYKTALYNNDYNKANATKKRIILYARWLRKQNNNR